jgi:predicted GH43/DUF377 family glycosyl hydrolase
LSVAVLQRNRHNPLLMPSNARSWEAMAAFNPCVVRDAGKYHVVYRAQSLASTLNGQPFSLSTIGYARSDDGVRFCGRRQIIKPEFPWEQFGCEDPRITKLGDKFYIFYTCLSVHPFEASGIRVGVAITRDFEHFEKQPVTPFNAKAMALFPERIGGKLAAILTVHTDMPPAKVAIALFDQEDQLWSSEFWEGWYRELDSHVVGLLRSAADQVEVGAPPLKTASGWLLVHCYVRDYFHSQRSFGIEAAMLELEHPQRVRSRTSALLLVPEREYELKGDVDNVVFPSGALIEDNDLVVYYGAADTTCCEARGKLDEVLAAMNPSQQECFIPSALIRQGFDRWSGNPILSPRAEFAWEAKAVFNPAALLLEGKVHLVYRAMSKENTSCFGYACSEDGIHFDERLPHPIYEPRAPFENKLRPGNSGCEDPRLTLLDDTVYLFYTAFDGYTPRVAFSALPLQDFLKRRWSWCAPRVITPPGVDDKDGGLMPAKIGGNYIVFHRARDCIEVHAVPSLELGDGEWLDDDTAVIKPRKHYWDNRKFGIAAPPLETPHGWLLFFHRVTISGSVYKVEAMLLDREHPSRVIAETAATLLEPETTEERFGQTPNVVFPCGAVIHDEHVMLYYGGADSVICLARMTLEAIYKRLGI